MRLWDTFINPCLASYRFSSHDTNGVSPFFALHGFDPTIPIDSLLAPRRKYQGSDYSEIYLENLHKAFTLMARRAKSARKKGRDRANTKVTHSGSYKIGDPVYYLKGKTSKLSNPWVSHFRIVKIRGTVNYTICIVLQVKHWMSMPVV